MDLHFQQLLALMYVKVAVSLQLEARLMQAIAKPHGHVPARWSSPCPQPIVASSGDVL